MRIPRAGHLDTNILLSALIRRDSLPGRILEAWFDDRFVLLTHPLLLDELRASPGGRGSAA